MPYALANCARCGKEFQYRIRHDIKNVGTYCSKQCMSNRHDVQEYFWNCIQKTETCWIWTGGTRGSYGRLRLNGKRIGAHRFAWELTHGPIPAGLEVLHHCDNPPCCNPAHLFLGTQEDNTADAMKKGRYVPLKGERNGMAKITPEQVKEIRNLSDSLSIAELANLYGLTTTQVRNIQRLISWPHIA